MDLVYYFSFLERVAKKQAKQVCYVYGDGQAALTYFVANRTYYNLEAENRKILDLCGARPLIFCRWLIYDTKTNFQQHIFLIDVQQQNAKVISSAVFPKQLWPLFTNWLRLPATTKVETLPCLSPGNCTLSKVMAFHAKMWEPKQSWQSISTSVAKQDYTKYAVSVKNSFPQTPFRDVPLLTGKYEKGSADTHIFNGFLEYLISKIEGKSVCLNPNVYRIQIIHPDIVARMNGKIPDLLPVTTAVKNALKEPLPLPVTIPSTLPQIVKSCSKRFIILPLSVIYKPDLPEEIKQIEQRRNLPNYEAPYYYGLGHATTLIVDKYRKEVRRNDSNGFPLLPERVAKEQFIDDAIRTEVLPRLGLDYQYDSVMQSCPRVPGAQALQADSGYAGGYCVAWATMFMSLLILNPQWNIDEIEERMRNAGKANRDMSTPIGKQLLTYINDFMVAVECLIPPYVSQLPNDTRRRLLIEYLKLQENVCMTGNLDALIIYAYPRDNAWAVIGISDTCGKKYKPKEIFLMDLSKLPVGSATTKYRPYVENAQTIQGAREISVNEIVKSISLAMNFTEQSPLVPCARINEIRNAV